MLWGEPTSTFPHVWVERVNALRICTTACPDFLKINAIQTILFNAHAPLSTKLKHLISVHDLKVVLCHKAMQFAVLKGVFIYYHSWETAYTHWVF